MYARSRYHCIAESCAIRITNGELGGIDSGAKNTADTCQIKSRLMISLNATCIWPGLRGLGLGCGAAAARSSPGCGRVGFIGGGAGGALNDIGRSAPSEKCLTWRQ